MTTETVSLTHTGNHQVSLDDIQTELQKIKLKLQTELSHDQPQLGVALSVLDNLSTFPLGRFLIKNKSLDGYWTYYIILGYNKHTITNDVEKIILEKAPLVLATRERFHIFQKLILQSLQSNMTVCSVPCGMMADLLTLKIPSNITNIKFVGIDLDQAIFDLAKRFKDEIQIKLRCDFFHSDAWKMQDENEFDILTSNGLNVYEKDDAKVTELYRVFHRSLKQGGKLIGSSLSLPNTWRMEKIDPDGLVLHKTMFSNILQATWANPRSESLTEQQLKDAGFENIVFYPDKANIFYSFEATKPLY